MRKQYRLHMLISQCSESGNKRSVSEWCGNKCSTLLAFVLASVFTFRLMRRVLLSLILLNPVTFAAPKQHVVSFGKWTSVKWFASDDATQATEVKIRPLVVDGHVKEFIIGVVHDITERTFAVQRMYRINDSLPEETGSPHWRWERGGWLLVDRVSGKVQALTLPEFDPYYSTASWFRDYAAYCGISDDGKKLLAMVAQVGKRKPMLKKAIGDAVESNTPESACSAPVWQRAPSRVTFTPKNEQKFTYTVRGRSLETTPEETEEAGDE